MRTQAFLLSALLMAASAAHAVPAGTVAFSQGQVNIRAAQGALRTAATGAPVESGETIETGQGRAQLRMVDGAYISLQPESALRLDNYQTATTTTPESGLMSLLRGGLRTVTGLIGRSNRANYKLSTPTATVGIRGTEFLATADNGTRVRVAGGAVALCTEGGGCLDIASGQTGFAPDRGSRPVIVSRAPALPPQAPPTTLAGFAVGEERNALGQSLSLAGEQTVYNTPLPDGSGSLGIVYANSSAIFSGGLLGGSITFDSQGHLLTFTDCCSSTNLSGGTVGDYGSDGIIAWGRWTAGTFNGQSITTVHYYATSTSQSPAVPVVQAYAAFASTAPTLTSTSNGALLATGTANSVTGSININFTGSSGGTATYLLNVPVAGQTFTINGSATQYSTLGFLGTSSSISSTGSGCSSGCTGNIPYADAIQGSVAGTGNTRVGANYGFTATSLGGNVSGTVVFK